METIILQQSQIQNVIDALNDGAIVAFPTETVFGLAVLYQDDSSHEKLATLKSRKQDKPISIMVKDVQTIETLAILSDAERKMINAFMPGQITGVFKKRDTVNDSLTMSAPTVGIRIPDHAFVLNLLKGLDKPLLVTSANQAGMPDACDTEQVLKSFDGLIPYVVDGHTSSNKPSTVVKIEGNEVIILRQGTVTKEEIERVIA